MAWVREGMFYNRAARESFSNEMWATRNEAQSESRRKTYSSTRDIHAKSLRTKAKRKLPMFVV